MLEICQVLRFLPCVFALRTSHHNVLLKFHFGRNFILSKQLKEKEFQILFRNNFNSKLCEEIRINKCCVGMSVYISIFCFFIREILLTKWCWNEKPSEETAIFCRSNFWGTTAYWYGLYRAWVQLTKCITNVMRTAE